MIKNQRLKNNRAVLLWFTICLLSTSPSTLANSQYTDSLKMIGQGTMSWFFIDIYQATLFSTTGRYQPHVYPLALNIIYLKDIDKQQLLDATEKQWQKLGLTRHQYAHWLIELNKIWPNIKQNEQLLFLIKGEGEGHFYHNNHLLGHISDPQFSENFIAIWLSKQTTRPKLRQQLLGQ